MAFTVLTPRQLNAVSKNVDRIGGAISNIVAALGGLPVPARKKSKARKATKTKAAKTPKTTKAKAASSPATSGTDLTA